MIPYRCLHPDSLVRRLADASALVNLAFTLAGQTRPRESRAMEELVLRDLIRSKLADGRLQRPRIAIAWGGPAKGETCAACEQIIPPGRLVVEGITGSGPTGTACFHVQCFQLWESERVKPGMKSTENRSGERHASVTGHVGEAECLTALTELGHLADQPERTYLKFAFTNGQRTRLPAGSPARLLAFGRTDLLRFIASLRLRIMDLTTDPEERHEVRRLLIQLLAL